MIQHLRSSLKKFSLVFAMTLFGVCSRSSLAEAWTTASLEDVVVTVELAKQGPSRVVTQVRFAVSGGKFHGFDFAEIKGSVLDEEDSRAALDDGRLYPLVFRRLASGKTRVLLGNKAEVSRGGVTFALIQTVDFVQSGYLRRVDGRAEFDWTPVVWDEGLLSARVELILPGPSRDGPIETDQEASKDYVIERERDRIELTKFRPVRWYPMRVVLSFDASLIDDLESMPLEETPPPVMAVEDTGSSAKPEGPPWHVAIYPLFVALLGLIILALKGVHVWRVHRFVGVRHRFMLLGDTPFALRLTLSGLAIALGLGAQAIGSVAAGIPALAMAAGLWLSRKRLIDVTAPGGGSWRMMDRQEVARLAELAKAYRRSRSSLLDITTVRGVLAFLAFSVGVGYGMVEARGDFTEISWVIFLDGFILAIPAWFSSVRAELPMDTTMESFSCLVRYRKKLDKVLRRLGRGGLTEFWLREVEGDPIEVRLRVADPPADLHGIEVAGEILRSGSLYRVRSAVVFRTEPGTESAKRVAESPHAAEHHLTPDLQEEIVVLRNRRGRALGMTPLRGALALLSR